jgi:hypothetical protein
VTVPARDVPPIPDLDCVHRARVGITYREHRGHRREADEWQGYAVDGYVVFTPYGLLVHDLELDSEESDWTLYAPGTYQWVHLLRESSPA